MSLGILTALTSEEAGYAPRTARWSQIDVPGVQRYLARRFYLKSNPRFAGWQGRCAAGVGAKCIPTPEFRPAGSNASDSGLETLRSIRID